MKAFIQIALAAGQVYEIPVAAVASSRAQAMLELHADEFPTIVEAMGDTVELFNDDMGQVRDWALNNMNWNDLEPVARLVRFTPPDLDLQAGEWTYHDHRAITGELDGATVMKSPVELVATVMMESQQLCNVTVLNGADGEPFGAVAVIIGSKQIVGAYLNTLKFTGDQITSGMPAATVQ